MPRATLLFILACTAGLAAGSAAPAEDAFLFHQPVVPPRAVQIVADRGLSQCAPPASVAALQECASDYIEWAMVAVRRTKDGHHVVVADEPFPVAPGGPRRWTAELTLAELRQADTGAAFAPRFAGIHPATLAEVLAAAQGRVNLVLNCRHVSPAELVREIQSAGMEQQVLLAGEPDALAEIQTAADPDLATLAPFNPQFPIEALIAARAPAVIELKLPHATPDRCRLLHSLGYKVLVSVAGRQTDSAETWQHVLAAGADLILTDHPAEVRFAEVRHRIPQFPVMIACHRGANRYAPENTLAAISLAAALGVDFIEIDIRTTSDGRFVLLHDRALDRTTSGQGPVSEQSAAAVSELDAGAWFGAPFAGLRVPTFDDGLRALGPRSHAYLDAKDIPPESLLAAVREHRLHDRHVVYQSVAYCRRLQELEPRVRLLPPLNSGGDLDAVAELRPYGVDAAWSILSQELIERCHHRGIRVFSDALGPHETLEDYRQAIRWGIDVIQTDHPLRVLRAIELEAQPHP
jgi:glycerophosphoryl diester phosphodiesterase